MPEKYETLDIEVDFLSKKIDTAIALMWNSFFDRVSDLGYSVDRAIWICNQYPAWVAVKPGSESDCPDNEPEFVISVVIGKVDSINAEIRKKSGGAAEYNTESKSLYRDYYLWLQNAITRSFEDPKILNRRKQLIEGEFGVYSTEIEDIQSSEFDEMTWIAGNKLT